MTKYTFTNLSLSNTNGKNIGTANFYCSALTSVSNGTYIITVTDGKYTYSSDPSPGVNGIITISVALTSTIYDVVKNFKDEITNLTIKVDTGSDSGITVSGGGFLTNAAIQLAINNELESNNIQLTSMSISVKND